MLLTHRRFQHPGMHLPSSRVAVEADFKPKDPQNFKENLPHWVLLLCLSTAGFHDNLASV